MKLEKHLERKAQENDEYLKIYDLWKVIKNNVCDILNNVSTYFPHFSLHNESHSKTICLQVERLLGEDKISQLSVTDTFMLLIVFYMHDIGMALRYEEVYEFFQSQDFKDKVLELSNCDDVDICKAARRILAFNGIGKSDCLTSDTYKSSLEVYNDVILVIENEFRGKHAKRSSDYVRNRLNLPDNIGIRFVNLAGEICKLHQENIERIMQLPYKSNGIIDDYIHPRFIASMLCIGDLLDLDTDRFSEENLKSSSPMPESSKLHMLKHKSIEHFLVEPNGIELISNSNSIQVYRIMRDWAKWIKDTCIYLSINWSQIAPNGFERAPYLKKCDLLVNDSTKWLQYADLKFSITNKKAFELLQGAGIYRDKFVCFREIIQNSIDATLLRIWNAESVEKNLDYASKPADFHELLDDKYKIKIDISLNEDDNILVEVRDFGIGISVEDLQYISNAGSLKNKKKIKKISTMPEWLKPSGIFGMGLQSIFQLTNKFTIITRTINELPKKVTFESSSDKGYIIVEDYNEGFQQGSMLSFIIDNSKIELDDLYCSEYHYRTINKSYLILDRINGGYNNIANSSVPMANMEKQLYDYVPVEMKIQNIYTNCMQTILKYGSISKYIFEIDNKYTFTKNNIFIKSYNDETNCVANMSIIMSDNDTHTYGKRDIIYEHKLGNVLFYKNVLVNSSEVERYSMRNLAVIPELDFSINMLGNSAGEVLQLNRNYVKESFKPEFRKICEKIFQQEICEIIKELINRKEDIGDISIIIYQLANYYNFMPSKFKGEYKITLENLKFNNYYSIDNEEVSYTFEELDNKNLYFIYDEVDKDVLDKSIDDIRDLTIEKKYCVQLKPERSDAKKHLLYHKGENMFIACIDSKYYKIIEAKCMYSNKNGFIFIKDKYAILDDFVCSIFYDLRIINSFKEFIILETCINSRKTFKDYYNNNDYIIELPIENAIREVIKKELLKKGQVINAQERFFHKIIESDIFSTNVKFIMKNNSKEEDEINEKYSELIKRLLQLIEDDNNTKYIQYILKLCNQNINRKRGYYEEIFYNNYLTM